MDFLDFTLFLSVLTQLPSDKSELLHLLVHSMQILDICCHRQQIYEMTCFLFVGLNAFL